jgi:hypothetical protein
VEAFLHDGLSAVMEEHDTTTWYAVRAGFPRTHLYEPNRGPLQVTLPRTAKRGSRQRPVSRIVRSRSTATQRSSKPR